MQRCAFCVAVQLPIIIRPPRRPDGRSDSRYPCRYQHAPPRRLEWEPAGPLAEVPLSRCRSHAHPPRGTAAGSRRSRGADPFDRQIATWPAKAAASAWKGVKCPACLPVCFTGPYDARSPSTIRSNHGSSLNHGSNSFCGGQPPCVSGRKGFCHAVTRASSDRPATAPPGLPESGPRAACQTRSGRRLGFGHWRERRARGTQERAARPRSRGADKGTGSHLVEAIGPARRRGVSLLVAARVEASGWRARLHRVAKHHGVAAASDNLVHAHDAPRAVGRRSSSGTAPALSERRVPAAVLLRRELSVRVGLVAVGDARMRMEERLTSTVVHESAE
eukprot:6173185-Prymnesium_polylepis.1